MPNLTGVTVAGLLHTFDHRIEFAKEWEFVILHGPNGVGKTKLFELVDATFKEDLARLRDIPFRAASFTFDDGSRLDIDKRKVSKPSPSARRAKTFRARRDVVGAPRVVDRLVFRLTRPGWENLEWSHAGEVRWEFIRSDLELDRLAAMLPARRTATSRWQELEVREAVLAELLDRYRETRSSKLDETEVLPAELSSFIRKTNVHLIETQRLLYVPDQAKRTRAETQSRVSYLSTDLVRRLREVLALSSQTTQELDRTFPRRVLLADSEPPEEVSNEFIVRRYNEQASLRDRLASIDLLDTSGDLPLPNERLSSWERRVLWTYLQDAAAKLESFEDILQRVELFRSIVNSRFLFKRIKIDRERGFVFETDAGQEIPPDRLSSGEQHELVLVYGLLFDVERGSLVLIDEPEISLHPAWQRKFLDDIVRISNLTSLRFMIATHSPQIIHKWWRRAVALAPEHDERDERSEEDGQ